MSCKTFNLFYKACVLAGFEPSFEDLKLFQELIKSKKAVELDG